MLSKYLIKFTVPGEPQAWCVWTRNTKEPPQHIRMKVWQYEIQAAAIQAMEGEEPYTGPVVLHMDFYRGKSPTLHPDLTNHIKAAEDALKGIAFTDDRQVVWGWCAKHQDRARPRTEFTIILQGESDDEAEAKGLPQMQGGSPAPEGP